MKPALIYNSRLFALVALGAIIASIAVGFCEDSVVPENPAGESSVEMLNATSVPSISLAIAGLGEHPVFPQGAKIAGGAFPLTNWKLLARPKNATSELGEVESEFKAQPGSSSTAVIIGDFLVEKEEGKKPKTRAAIVVLPGEFVSPDKPNRLILINGIPDKAIEINLDNGASDVVDSLAEKRWSGLPHSVSVAAKVEGVIMKVPIEFVDPTRSAVVAFYLKDGKPAFVASAQLTLKD
ncbi:MAG TPA: hypothetical protein VIU12_01765, partial [Chryseolinea sp.]